MTLLLHLTRTGLPLIAQRRARESRSRTKMNLVGLVFPLDGLEALGRHIGSTGGKTQLSWDLQGTCV